MYYLIYKTTNHINGKYYIGAHRTENKDDDYLGSGVALRRAIDKYGKDSFRKEILLECSSAEEMFSIEEQMVDHLDPWCYNMRNGGKGGWDHIDSRGDKNPMKRPEVVAKVISTARKNGSYTSPKKLEHLKNISSNGGKIAGEGKKNNPEYSARISEISKKIWANPEYKEKFRDILASTFDVYSPDGTIYKTNRLQDFCKEKNLGYTSLWNTSRTNMYVKKGRSKGWKCQKITQL